MSENKTYEYQVSSEHFKSFNVRIRNGKVVWCSDASHLPGADWDSLRKYYMNATWGAEVKEVKEDGNL